MADQISDVEIERRSMTDEERTPSEKTPEIPKYYQSLTLTPDQETRLRDMIFAEFDAIKLERQKEVNLEQKWKALDNQYDGKMEEVEDQQFNLHKPTTKIKVDAVVRHIKESFFDQDPIFSVSPRPEFARQGGHEIVEKQEDYLDYKLDTEIPLRDPMGRVLKSAVLKGVGILKWKWEIYREKRTREEIYRGQLVPIIDPATGQPAVDPVSKKPIFQNPELERFLENYPSAVKDYPSIVERIAQGNTVPLTIQFVHTTYDDPMPEAVDLENFYVRKSTNGYEGLKRTRLTMERQEFTWWELQQLVKAGQFSQAAVDRLRYMENEKGESVVAPDFETDKYCIFECVVKFSINGGFDDEEKLVCWIEEDTKEILSTIRYPYTGVPAYYVPHYISSDEGGFYRKGLGEFLTDTNLAEDALLNFILEGVWAHNMVTPITPTDSDVDTQFLEKRWTHGIPINADPKEIDFLQNRMRNQFDVQALMLVMNTIARDNDDVTGVSSLLTGRESPLDPEAPASKTIALLERSGINIKDYVRHLLPAFNKTADIILQLTYQMTQEGSTRSFQRRLSSQAAVTGDQIFATISRDEMIARTNIQSQAYAFDFDRVRAKREDLALLQVLSSWPLFTQNPDGVYVVLKQLVKGWSQKWRNIGDRILPTPEQFRQQKAQAATQALVGVIQENQEREKLTGQPGPIDTQKLMLAVTQLQSEVTSPVPEDLAKQREKEARGA